MKNLIVIFALILVGCGCGDQDQAIVDTNNHGWGFEYDVQGASGLRLRYAPGVPHALTTQLTTAIADITLFESMYYETQLCTSLLYVGRPLIIVFPPGVLKAHGIITGGFTFFDTHTILIEEATTFPLFKQNLHHENVHDLLANHGFPGNLNSAHRSALFDQCGLM